ncbi:MAG: hypothetical protein A3E19_06850 [Planctomycetes bacterium RIFCSPHIGHO2_12_FULL_52_36]|nr:MAG: hypothetical protein A3D89_01875 [Planctomycetes bacterium RIFCSPHIGHO2_02_FULL_52_58]OHB94329.1 MAG: hypothetical protein A3E19_06850 [Planctomycetes bacterium RIFCSPHIGHO2_12_FULL_52_36]
MAGYMGMGGAASCLHRLASKTVFNAALLAISGLILFNIDTPLWAEYSNTVAKEHYEKGLNYINKGYPDLAIEEMKEAARLQPEVMEGHRYLALAYTLRLALNKAIMEYEAMFKISPDTVEVPPVKGRWITENEEVLHELKRELTQIHASREHHNPLVHVMLGWLYGEEGMVKEAHKELLHAREKAPHLDKENLRNEDKAIAHLMEELITAMQSSPSQAKTQLGLLLYVLNR